MAYWVMEPHSNPHHFETGCRHPESFTHVKACHYIQPKVIPCMPSQTVTYLRLSWFCLYLYLGRVDLLDETWTASSICRVFKIL